MYVTRQRWGRLRKLIRFSDGTPELLCSPPWGNISGWNLDLNTPYSTEIKRI
jgi:hypothetical protein